MTFVNVDDQIEEKNRILIVLKRDIYDMTKLISKTFKFKVLKHS